MVKTMSDNENTCNGIIQPVTMSDRDLQSFMNIIYSECGISLTREKKPMITARLSKRLRALSMDSFKDYYEFVISPEGREKELRSMIDVITTNTTEFFRESKHFDFLINQYLPALLRTNKRHLNIWSAGCSSGEEPYSLAMILAEHYKPESITYSILATDISSKVLSKAQNAVYSEDVIDTIPSLYRYKYLMRGKGNMAGKFRIVPELRDAITFKSLNFMDESFEIETQMDIIFCRNVIIYFDRKTKSGLVQKFYDQLVPDGFYFIGHSETLNSINDKFTSVAPTIYRKPVR